MTEPDFSLTGEPASLQTEKTVRKRSAATGSTRRTPGTKTKLGPEASLNEATAGEPVPSKPRARRAKPVESPTADSMQTMETVPKKRSPRKSAAGKASQTEFSVDFVRDSAPAETDVAPQPGPAQIKPRRRKNIPTQDPASPGASGETSQEHEPAPNGAVPSHIDGGEPRRRASRSQETSTAGPATHEAATQEAQPPAHLEATADFSERARKPYPVYVPLHIAKQMEQEGRPAPLAVDADAQQAESIRAAAQENRHPQPPGTQDVSQADPAQQTERPEGHRQDRLTQPQQQPHHRQDRHPHQRQHPNQRNPQRGPGNDRGRDGRNNDRHRNREDHRRNDRREHAHEAGYPEANREHSRELPPPTPEELSPGGGIIEISGKGFGFLRDPLRNFAQHPADIFVSPEMVRRFNLRDGQMIEGTVRRSGRGQQMHEIRTVNGDAPEESRNQPAFDELTVINPCEPLQMATVPERYTTRIIDMLTPIGKGQRGLIVAQPRTGKTTFLQHIADAMVKNHPEVKLIILLVDERPEEVTEIRHTVPSAEIMASSNDMDVRSHTRIAELAIERAKRLVEAGKDVFILLDSITRLGRAFNNALSNGGRTMSGGLDARALETPRKLFAAARNTEEAGSLTIVATALIDTGSRMDEIIFQEFKGTGNMELVLDRKIAESRIYPAVDIFQSGTRREELLVPADLLQKVHFLRRGLSGARPLDAIDRLLSYMRKFQTNEQMLREIRG
jgi:transcription termination factor Rho